MSDQERIALLETRVAVLEARLASMGGVIPSGYHSGYTCHLCGAFVIAGNAHACQTWTPYQVVYGDGSSVNLCESPISWTE